MILVAFSTHIFLSHQLELLLSCVTHRTHVASDLIECAIWYKAEVQSLLELII